MRVTMVNKYYPPHLGGIEYHLRDLATGLAARGNSVRAIVANEADETATEIVDGVEVVRLRRAFAYASTPVAMSMCAALRAEARGGLGAPAPDVMHLHFPYPWGEASWLASRIGTGSRASIASRAATPDRTTARRTPTVLTYHSDIVRQRVLGTLYAPILRRVLDGVDLIIASSPNMVEHSPFLARVADKCRVVPFGIPIERFEATPERIARAAELRAPHGGRPIVLFVGRLIYYKGVDVLVRAMADVDADLVIIGDGPLRPDLEALAASLGIAGRVFFAPPVTSADLAAWYHAADIFCLPSVARSEAFGLVQLEAQAAGAPVVSTALTTGVPFVNEHGTTGLVVPPGNALALADALSTLVTDGALRARLGEQAETRAREKFSLGRMIDDTIAVYDEARGVA